MPEAITVANSSCLIALEAIGRLELLQTLYTRVHVPEAVARECGTSLPQWIQVEAVQNRTLVQSLRLELGHGEAEAIALSSELAATRLILDDKKARRVAQQLSLPVTGTLAVLLVAKNRGAMSCVKPVIEALRDANFHLSTDLMAEILRRAGE
jgi:hypothetical protein